MKWMDRERSFWVIGGDLRQRALARLLREDGHTVHIAGLEGEGLEPEPLGPGLALAHCVILPLPVAVGESFVHTPLSAARLPLSQVLEMTRRGLRWADYYAREECMVANAVPTAEGAVQVAMEELPITLHSARVLILGFGRVGKLTAHRMGALGAKVTVSAQSYEDLAWAAAYGYETDRLEDLAWELGGFDLVVNTIPAPVLDERRLRWVDPGAFLLDLASAPGGIDRAAAQRRNLQVLQAPGLPGRVAPVTAAAAIRDAVYHILWEQEA